MKLRGALSFPFRSCPFCLSHTIAARQISFVRNADVRLLSSTRSEKRVFLAAARERHPFLLGLHSCFQTETRVYFVMEYVSGGDLMLHIQRKQFSLRQAKFYASEVLLALEYFHANGIIYRYVSNREVLQARSTNVKLSVT